MSGGSHNYIYYQIEEELSGQMEDKEINLRTTLSGITALIQVEKIILSQYEHSKRSGSDRVGLSGLKTMLTSLSRNLEKN